MTKPYLLKVLLCEAVDRLKAVEHLIDSIGTLPDENLLRLLKHSRHMMKVVKDASKKWKEHSLRCEIAHGFVWKEAEKRGLLEEKEE